MSTRGIWGFKCNDDYVLTYNHFDSYPQGLGKKLVSEYLLLGHERVCYIARNLEKVYWSTPITDKIIDKLKEFTNLSISSQNFNDWYCLLEGTQGSIIKTATAGYIMQESSYIENGELDLSNSLFWGYIFDLDKEQFLIYYKSNQYRERCDFNQLSLEWIENIGEKYE